MDRRTIEFCTCDLCLREVIADDMYSSNWLDICRTCVNLIVRFFQMGFDKLADINDMSDFEDGLCHGKA